MGELNYNLRKEPIRNATMIRYASPLRCQEQHRSSCPRDETYAWRQGKKHSTKRKELGYATGNAIVKSCTMYLSIIVTIFVVFAFVMSFLQYTQDDLHVDDNLRFVYLEQKQNIESGKRETNKILKKVKRNKINSLKASAKHEKIIVVQTILDDNILKIENPVRRSVDKQVANDTSTIESTPLTKLTFAPDFKPKNNGALPPIDNPYFGYASDEEIRSRGDRFPSTQDRVKVYMSNWYLPPCKMKQKPPNLVWFQWIDTKKNQSEWKIVYENGSEEKSTLLIKEVKVNCSNPIWDHKKFAQRSFYLSDSTGNSQIHFMNRRMFEKCQIESCTDVLNSWYPIIDQMSNDLEKRIQDVPFLFQFGDHILSKAYSPDEQRFGEFPAMPHLKKSRQSLKYKEGVLNAGMSPSNVGTTNSCYEGMILPAETIDGKRDYLQPIIYKLKTRRHYGSLMTIPDEDVPWQKKKNVAVFRGALTGVVTKLDFVKKVHGLRTEDRQNPDILAEIKCMMLDRCRLVFKNGNSTLLDTKLISRQAVPNEIPNKIQGIDVFGDYMSKQKLLQYKAIIMLEGNDAGTGLKWALFSNSVVMMPRPRFTSWAMEEFLQPWVHYIPLNEDLSDAQDKMQWVLDHEEAAQEIAWQGSLWIRDLVLHPDSKSDDEAITREIILRYIAHFQTSDN